MSSTAAQDDRDVNAAKNILAAGHCRLAGGITFPLRLALPPKQCFVVAQVGEDVNTDGADGQAAHDWQQALAAATFALQQVMHRAVQAGCV